MAANLKNRSGGNKYALQNKDTVISLPETFEVSRALQKKIHVGSEKEERAADLVPAAWILAVRPSHDSGLRSMTPRAHFSALGGCFETRERAFRNDELVLE
jgi:hypothetical protein